MRFAVVRSTSSMLPIFTDGSSDFAAHMRRLSSRGADDLAAVEPAVRDIIANVRATGDEAVRTYIERFEHRRPEQLVGDVDIDGLAGPSENIVLADDAANPAFVAADLLSQAEHDEAACCVLLTTTYRVARAVLVELDAQVSTLSRKTIASESLHSRGVAFVVDSLERMAEVASLIAAEHVAYHVTNPEALFDLVEGSGAALLGDASPVAVGDYFAGPSHVLPTGGAARFGSPLGVYDFVVRASVIRYSQQALRRDGPHIATFARAEELDAHARAVEIRMARSSLSAEIASPEADPGS